MTREEAILWLKNINTREFGWDDYAMQDSQKEIRERCEQCVREAIDMAISALSAEEKLKSQLANCHKEILRFLLDDDFEKVVRCRDCFMHDECKAREWYGEDGYCSVGDKHEDDDNYFIKSPNEVVEKNDEVIDHDREWIMGCIKHDGFIKTDRFDKANQIILDALSAEPIERTSDNTIVVKYADYEDIGRIILTNEDIFCKIFYEDGRQNDDSDYDSLVPDEYKTEPSDLISRAEALAYPLSFDHYDKENGNREFICGVESYREYIQHLPSVKATENKYDCDLISRADAIEAICETIMSEFDYPPTAGYEIAEKSLKTLPSVSANSDDLIIKNGKGIQDGLYNIKDGEIFKYKAKGGTVRAHKLVPSVSAERSGEWEYEIMVMPLSNHTKDSYRCSVCHTHWDCETNYCPNCGARMENKE